MATVTFLLGSKTDTPHAEAIAELLKEFGVSYEIIPCSAHKAPEKLVPILEKLNAQTEPSIVVTIAGMSNGLSGVTAGTCVHPVIACPPFKDLDDYNVNIHSTMQMPSDVPVLTVINPKNCALSCLRILAQHDPALKEKLMERMKKVKAGY